MFATDVPAAGFSFRQLGPFHTSFLSLAAEEDLRLASNLVPHELSRVHIRNCLSWSRHIANLAPCLFKDFRLLVQEYEDLAD